MLVEILKKQKITVKVIYVVDKPPWGRTRASLNPHVNYFQQGSFKNYRVYQLSQIRTRHRWLFHPTPRESSPALTCSVSPRLHFCLFFTECYCAFLNLCEKENTGLKMQRQYSKDIPASHDTFWKCVYSLRLVREFLCIAKLVGYYPGRTLEG